MQVRPREAAGAIARDHRRQLGRALVQPRFLVLVNIPVDHVLKLVRQHALVVRRANRPAHRVEVDEEHLGLVRGRHSFGRILAGAGVVSGDPVPHVARVQDDEVRIAVDAGGPFFPEDLVHARTDGFLKHVGRALDRFPVGGLPDLVEDVDVIGLVDQLRIDLELVIVVEVVDPEGPHRAQFKLRRWRGGRLRDVRHAEQTARQVDPVALRDDRFAGQRAYLPLAARVMAAILCGDRCGSSVTSSASVSRAAISPAAVKCSVHRVYPLHAWALRREVNLSPGDGCFDYTSV